MSGAAIDVLIIDDDIGDRMQIRRALAKSGVAHELVEASNMEEALQACEEKPFDTVIVDYNMPGLNGLGGIARLHERHPLLPIIMSTGQGCEQVAAEAIKLGALDYILKSDINEQTVRRAIESAMERASLNRKLAGQQEALENFARILAHDLKNPIASVIGFADLNEFELQKQDFDRERVLQSCRRIGRAARSMQAIIETLRQYTQLDSEVKFEPVYMRAVVESVMENMERTIRERGADILYEDLPTVRGSAPQLAQLMQNLIGNSIKYCEAEKPVVRILARKQPDGNGDWLFEVCDNGIGIPARDCDRVFDPFKRLHSASRYEGTGLGLAICRKIVERHDGSIWCKSAEGEGTSFFFTLAEAGATPQEAQQGILRQRLT
jgi:signal transduction histidine kinase